MDKNRYNRRQAPGYPANAHPDGAVESAGSPPIRSPVVGKFTIALILLGAGVVAPATASAADCDPNYSGACVPIASDVDCAGGSGNGPAYVAGPVNVIGRDIYKLDSDGNGVGCE